MSQVASTGDMGVVPHLSYEPGGETLVPQSVPQYLTFDFQGDSHGSTPFRDGLCAKKDQARQHSFAGRPQDVFPSVQRGMKGIGQANRRAWRGQKKVLGE